jgi:hypothetical protein
MVVYALEHAENSGALITRTLNTVLAAYGEASTVQHIAFDHDSHHVVVHLSEALSTGVQQLTFTRPAQFAGIVLGLPAHSVELIAATCELFYTVASVLECRLTPLFCKVELGDIAARRLEECFGYPVYLHRRRQRLVILAQVPSALLPSWWQNRTEFGVNAIVLPFGLELLSLLVNVVERRGGTL